VRRADQAEILREHGVTPILFKGLNDLPALEEIAGDFDIVINCALASHTESAIAMINGLVRRKEKTGKDVHFIHVGTLIGISLPCSVLLVSRHRKIIISHEL
jgi:hypothetical protein